MKIVHIITRLILGGAQENTLLSCEGQHARGHDVTLITGPAIGPEGSLLPRAQGGGYRVIVLDEMRRAIHLLRDARIYFALKKSIEQIQPDVVHTHSSKAGIIGRFAAARSRSNCAVVHTIHGLSFTASTSPVVNSVYKFLERRAAKVSDKIICVADAMRDVSLSQNIGTREQYATVYSGMPTAPYLNPPVPRDEVRRALGFDDSHVVAGTIARLFDLKGHDDLLALAPKLCARFPNLRFLWVGDGSLRTRFESQIAAMDLRDRFILTGLVPPEQIPQLTNAMDLLIHPSRREGLARALPQAALAGKPVIAYDIDGNREAIIEGESGFAIAPFNIAKLENAVETLLVDPARRTLMGSCGREFASVRFDTKAMIDGLDQVYSTLPTLPRKAASKS